MLSSGFTVKRIYFCLIVFVSTVATALFAAQDAAIEVQEGDIEHWIEYYKKERGVSSETAPEEDSIPKVEPLEAARPEPSAPRAETKPQSRD
jgi:hypothetical protein